MGLDPTLEKAGRYGQLHRIPLAAVELHASEPARVNIVTDFGKLADPIADKALAGAALIGLSVLGELPWWITVVMLGREVGVTVLRFWVIRHGVIAASRGGKIKTVLQVLAICLYVLPGPPGIVRAVVMGLAVVATVVTGADYAIRAVRLHRR